MSKAREAFRDWISTQKKSSEGKPNGISKKHIVLLLHRCVLAFYFIIIFFLHGNNRSQQVTSLFLVENFNLMRPFVLYGRAMAFITSTQVVQSDEFS